MPNYQFIKGDITDIGAYAFYGSGLVSITIPSGVTTIGTQAFYGCFALTSINFNATAMGDLSSSENDVFINAGQSASGIAVTIGANATKIPEHLFLDAANIRSVVFETGSVCTSIGDGAFQVVAG